MVGDANVTGDSGADTHPCGEVASTLIVLSSLWPPLLTRLKQHGPNVSCINWNEP